MWIVRNGLKLGRGGKESVVRQSVPVESLELFVGRSRKGWKVRIMTLTLYSEQTRDHKRVKQNWVTRVCELQ